MQLLKALSAFIPAIIMLFIGIFVFAHNPKNRMNQFFFFGVFLFGIYTILISARDLLDYLVTSGILDVEKALHYQSIRSLVGGFIVPIFGAVFFNFCLIFPENQRNRINRNIILITFFLALVLGSTVFSSHWVTNRHYEISDGIYQYFSDNLILYYFTAIFTAGMVLAGLIILAVKYARVKFQQYKSQIALLGIGMFLNALIAAFAELVGTYYGYSFLIGVGSLIFSVTAAIAIVKHRLLDIRTILHRAMMWIVIYLLIWLPIFIGAYFFSDLLQKIPAIPRSVLIAIILFGFIFYFQFLRQKMDHLFHSTRYKVYQKIEDFLNQVVITRDVRQIAQKTEEFLRNTIFPESFCFYTLSSPFLFSRQSHQFQCLWNIGVSNPPQLNRNIFIHYLEDHPVILFKEELQLYNHYRKISRYGVNVMNDLNGVLIIPLVMTNRFIGFISLGARKNGSPYDDNDLKLMEMIRTQLTIAVSNALYIQQMEFKKQIDNDLVLAMELQKHLLPADLPVTRTLTTDVLYLPARGIGGDYYDMIPLKNEQLFITMADVSGKGISAGLITVMIRTMVHTEIKPGRSNIDIKRVVSDINMLLSEALNEDKYSTLIALKYDSPSRKLQMINAGHLPLIVYRPENNETLQFSSDDLPLGIIPHHHYRLHEIQLLPGDVGLIYTDGITEAINETEQEYGLTRLLDIIKNLNKKEPEEIVAAVLKDLDDFIGKKHFLDDLTLIVFKIG